MTRRATPLFVASLIFASTTAVAGTDVDSRFDPDRALALSRDAIGRTLDNFELTDQAGRSFHLHELKGKPLLVSLIYTSCFHTCPIMTQQLNRAVGIARDALGTNSFRILSVGFDTANDTPQRMRLFARERGIDDPNWIFASGDEGTIAALTQQLGFTYFRSPRGFDHLTQTSMIDENGKVHHQVYGDMVHAPSLVEPLKQLVWKLEARPSTFSGWLKSVKLFCTVYDPNSGRYRFDYSIFVSIIIGIACLGAGLFFVVRAWRQSPPHRPA